MPVFALLTDFGLQDQYVGQMKGVLTSLAPATPIIDISHSVLPQNITQASFFLHSSLRYLPSNVIVLCIVDPGVGSERAILCLSFEGRTILAPDNGLLAQTLFQAQTDAASFSLIEIDTSKYAKTSATFHGRDIFAPVAAAIATGTSPLELGSPIQFETTVSATAQCIPPLDVRHEEGLSTITCSVLHIDHFGNCILSLPADQFLSQCIDARLLTINAMQGQTIYSVDTYANIPAGECGILAGSQGYLELAVQNGSASNALALSISDTITITIYSA